MWEGCRCPYKWGRGPSFSYPSMIPFLYRQLNRSYDEFHTIKTVHFYFFISSSTILRDTYRRNVFVFPSETPREIYQLYKPKQELSLPASPRGVTQQSFCRGGSAPRCNPLPFYIPFLTKPVPLFLYFSLTNGTHFTQNKTECKAGTTAKGWFDIGQYFDRQN